MKKFIMNAKLPCGHVLKTKEISDGEAKCRECGEMWLAIFVRKPEKESFQFVRAEKFR